MRVKIPVLFAPGLMALAVASFAADNLDGAYKFKSVTFQGGQQTEAEAKGMIVVHGKYWSNVRVQLNRKSWSQNDPEEERIKKIAAAFNGLTANCGTFEIEGNIVTMYNMAAASPGSVGTSSKWEYKLEGTKLTLKPQAAPGVEFVFEKLP